MTLYTLTLATVEHVDREERTVDLKIAGVVRRVHWRQMSFGSWHNAIYAEGTGREIELMIRDGAL